MHNDFLRPDITAKTLEYVHITEKEKDIAEDLIQKGYLVKKECQSLENIELQSFYELKLPFQGVSTLVTGQRCKNYQLSEVGGSNAFLGKRNSHKSYRSLRMMCHIQLTLRTFLLSFTSIGIISRDSSCSSKTCSCSSSKECSNVQGLTCECPCSSRLGFHYCRSEFPASK